MKKNKTGVEYVNIEYIYNNNVTVCVLDCAVNIKHVSSFYGLNRQNAERFIKFISNLGMEYDGDSVRFTVKGVTRLHNGDDYDKVTGERIALSKAQAWAFSKANRMYNFLGGLVNEELETLYEKVEGTYNVCAHCYKHVEELGE